MSYGIHAAPVADLSGSGEAGQPVESRGEAVDQPAGGDHADQGARTERGSAAVREERADPATDRGRARAADLQRADLRAAGRGKPGPGRAGRVAARDG